MREIWKQVPPVSPNLIQYFDGGHVDNAPSYGDWLRQPYVIDDGDVDRALIEQTPPETAQRVLGKVAFEMACLCDRVPATNEQSVDDFIHLYGMDDPVVNNHCRMHSRWLTKDQRTLIGAMLENLARSGLQEEPYFSPMSAARWFK